MKVIILITVLLFVNSLTVKQTDICTCAQLKSQTDCQKQTECTWASSACSKSAETTIARYHSQCTTITTGSQCAKTRGCGYTGGKCDIFSGCEAYAATQPSQCQDASTECNFNGSYCIKGQTCSSQTTQPNCLAIKQVNGSIFCKWTAEGSKCEEISCSDAPNTIMTDADCEKFYPGCLTNKRGCVSQFKECSNQTVEDCPTVIAKATKDAQLVIQICQLNSDNTTCVARTCAMAPENKNTDVLCKEYLEGCITNNKGCVIGPTLPECKAYNYPNTTNIDTTCAGLIGKDGKCYGIKDAKNCEKIPCNSNITATTDEVCKTVNNDCITTGKGCVDILLPCSEYNTTDLDCNLRKVKVGKCIKKSDSDKLCSLATCADATASTPKEECSLYGTNCGWNGTKCDILANCDTYKGTDTTCRGIYGADGKCKGDTADQLETASCIVDQDTCKSAPVTLTTDAACLAYHQTCTKTTGKGCIKALGECTTYAFTDTTCDSLVDTSGKKCTKDSTASATSCKLRVCSEATVTTTTDEGCAAYQTGCVTNNKKCVAALGTCASYKGTTDVTCDGLKGTDGLCKASDTPTGSCLLQVCTDNTTSTTEAVCVAQQNECGLSITGKGCKVRKPTCAENASKELCEANLTQETQKGCAWDKDTLACRVIKCSDAPSGNDTDAKCISYLAGCKSDGITCYDPLTFTCSDIQSQTSCLVDSQGKGCLWYDKKCQSYSGCESLIFTEHSQCQEFSKLCTSNGTNCIAMQACQNITTKADCTTGSDGNCGYISNKCQLFTKCEDAVGTTTEECGNYNSQCISDGKNCMAKGLCTSYTTQIACNSGGSDGACTYDETAKTCKLTVCSDATDSNGDIKTNAACSTFVASTKCTTDGTACVAIGKCETYKLKDNCVLGTDGDCFYVEPATTDGEGTCRAMVCSDHTLDSLSACAEKSCAFDSSTKACVAPNKCASYTSTQCTSASSDATETCILLAGVCKAFSACADGNEDQTICEKKGCQYTAATDATKPGTCASKTCASATSASTCQYLTNMDSTYTVCVPDTANKTCKEGEVTELAADNCNTYTANTYSWNPTTSKCEFCKSQSGTTTNSTNTTNTTNATGTEGGTTQTSSGEIVQFEMVLIGAIMILNY